jgi:hypothetical protein
MSRAAPHWSIQILWNSIMGAAPILPDAAAG